MTSLRSDHQDPKRKRRILLIDDDPTFQRSAQSFLQRRFSVQCARSLEEAMPLLEQTAFAAVLLDLEFHERLVTTQYDGFAALPWLRKNYPEIPVLVVSKTTDPKEISYALDAGAYHFVTKLFKASELANLIERAMDSARLRKIVQFERGSENVVTGDFVGGCEAILQIREMVRCVAPSELPVLVTGESGTGKELLAREIHRSSGRKGEFRALNLSVFNDELQAAELFGTTGAAYTGAIDRPGYFELCDGGTLFLDEVADLSPRCQAMLLRVLQDGIVTRLGSQRQIQSDVRVLAATNRPLDDLIEKSEFRRDLWSRLTGVELQLPPLRERGDDILLIADHLLAHQNGGNHRSKLSESARRLLMRYPWPGNVRELQFCLARTAVLSQQTVLEAEDLLRWNERLAVATDAADVGLAAPSALSAAQDGGTESWSRGLEADVEALWPYDHGRREIEAAYRRASLKRAMALAGGNVSEAARLLGVSRVAIYKWMEGD